MNQFVSRVLVTVVGVPVVLCLVYLGDWWLFGLAAVRGARRAARVLRDGARAAAARARGLRGRARDAARRPTRRTGVDDRRLHAHARPRVPALRDRGDPPDGDGDDELDDPRHRLDRARPRASCCCCATSPSTAGSPSSPSCWPCSRTTPPPTSSGGCSAATSSRRRSRPGKTWEGFVAGTVAAVAVAFFALYETGRVPHDPAVDRARARDRARRRRRRPLRVGAEARPPGQGLRSAPRRPRRHARPDRLAAVRLRAAFYVVLAFS